MTSDSHEQIHRLWDHLSDADAGQSEEAAIQLMEQLCSLSGAWSATWAAAVRVNGTHDGDPLEGWRVRALKGLNAVDPEPVEPHFEEIVRIWERREIDPSFLLPLKDVGTFRTYALRRDLPASWFDGAFYARHYGSAGISDAAFVAFPLNEDCESHFGFYSASVFTADQIELFACALRSIKWFHRRLMLSNGLLLSSAPLTPMERRVLQLLLTKATEKEIGRHVEIAPSTAHQHVTSIFRKFGVRSRAELMSLWLKSPG